MSNIKFVKINFVYECYISCSMKTLFNYVIILLNNNVININSYSRKT